MQDTNKHVIQSGKAVLGIELGSTRIKAVLIGENHEPIASGGHDWENRLEDGIWTYSLEDVWTGLQSAYAKLVEQVTQQYSTTITSVKAIGISAMMHGWLAFGSDGKLLAPFRTWRNTITENAAALLTENFNFSVPQRWSIAHLYQSILNNEPYVADIDFITTLSGYVHWKLTGQRVLGVGDASGMFPISDTTGNYHEEMLSKFDGMISDKSFKWKLTDILPKVLSAGCNAGCLSSEGAALLDPAGNLKPEIALCPPEGDAGTGMVATNSIAPFTGNVSAGTSIFAMLVLNKGLSKVYTEIDIVTTPAGKPVAMVHCNNCTSDLDAWVKLLAEAHEATGISVAKPALYDALYEAALKGEADAGGLFSCNYLSGEHLTGFEEGRPMFVRTSGSKLTLGNFMRSLLYATMATLKLGMNILTEQENVTVETLMAHGGLFKTPVVGQTLMAGALNVPVSVMESAGEGGAWGIALLAAYLAGKESRETLDEYLAKKVFNNASGTKVEPDPTITAGFNTYMERYKQGLLVERAAVEHLK